MSAGVPKSGSLSLGSAPAMAVAANASKNTSNFTMSQPPCAGPQDPLDPTTARAFKSERFGGAEHVVDVPVDLYFTPLVAQYTVGVDEKGAPLDPEHLLPVHILFFDYVELLAELLVRVGQKVEGKGVFRPELLVGAQAVARHAEHSHAQTLERGLAVAEALALERAPGRVVLGIEVEHVRRAREILAAHGTVRRGRGERRHFLADRGCCHSLLLVPPSQALVLRPASPAPGRAPP